MTNWGQITDGEIEYDLSHLDNFHLVVELPTTGEKFSVLVTFWHHTFAREVRDGDPDHLIVTRDGDARCFCPIRHKLSLTLPELIRYGANGKACFGEEKSGRAQNFLFVRDLEGHEGPYAIFFNMTRANEKDLDVVMQVTSAYLKPGLIPNPDKIKFRALVKIVATGGTVQRPPKRW